MNILVVEDHAPTRDAIVSYLSTEVQGRVLTAGSSERALGLIADQGSELDVALIDLNLGEQSGLVLIRALALLAVPSIVLTISAAAADVSDALAAGATGYLLKDDPPEALVRALFDATRGRNPISSGVTHHLIRRPSPGLTAGSEAGLTPREVEVLVALARGLTYVETAEALGCALGTIQTHVKSLYAKLEVNSKTEACGWAFANGVVE